MSSPGIFCRLQSLLGLLVSQLLGERDSAVMLALPILVCHSLFLVLGEVF